MYLYFSAACVSVIHVPACGLACMPLYFPFSHTSGLPVRQSTYAWLLLSMHFNLSHSTAHSLYLIPRQPIRFIWPLSILFSLFLTPLYCRFALFDPSLTTDSLYLTLLYYRFALFDPSLLPIRLSWPLSTADSHILITYSADETLVLILACLDSVDPPFPAYLVCSIPSMQTKSLSWSWLLFTILILLFRHI